MLCGVLCGVCDYLSCVLPCKKIISYTCIWSIAKSDYSIGYSRGTVMV